LAGQIRAIRQFFPNIKGILKSTFTPQTIINLEIKHRLAVIDLSGVYKIEEITAVGVMVPLSLSQNC